MSKRARWCYKGVLTVAQNVRSSSPCTGDQVGDRNICAVCAGGGLVNKRGLKPEVWPRVYTCEILVDQQN